MSDQIFVQRIELLAVAPGQSPSGEQTVVLTIRPDQGSFRPHNVALSRSQAKRLLRSLRAVLRQPPLILLLSLALTSAAGCSAEVEVTSEKVAPRAAPESAPPAIEERSKTAVSVSLLDRREPKPLEQESPVEELPADEPQPEPEERVEITGDGNVVVVVEGDFRRSEPDHDQSPAPDTKPRSGWNTKLGWPTQYRRAGGWTWGCYLAVWALVLAAVVLMIDALGREQGGPLLSVVAVLGTAAVLLQCLPYTESGLQLVPLPPWSYTGWVSFGVSLACWAAILVAGYVALSGCLDAPRAFAAVCLFALLLNLLLSFSEAAGSVSRSPAMQI